VCSLKVLLGTHSQNGINKDLQSGIHRLAQDRLRLGSGKFAR